MNLYETVAKGLVVMLARNMEYAPAADEIPIVAKILTQDLVNMGYADCDSDRIGHALNLAGRNFDKWPSTFQIKSSIPARRDWEWKPDVKRLPESEERRKKEKDRRFEVAKPYMQKMKLILNIK